jgi:hypothetical protein
VTKLEEFMEEEAQAMARRDLAVTIEVAHKWDNKKQKHMKDLQYQIFSYRQQGLCPPGDTIADAIDNARKLIKEFVSQHKPECPTPAGPARNCYVCRDRTNTD